MRKRYDFTESNFHEKLQCLSLEREFSFDELIAACGAVNLNLDTDLLFTEYVMLQKFILRIAESPNPNCVKSVVEKFVDFFSNEGSECKSVMKLMSLVLSINCSNAAAERVFSLMRQVWTDQRNRLRVESVRAELQIIINYQDRKCGEVYNEFLQNSKILNAARGSRKYE